MRGVFPTVILWCLACNTLVAAETRFPYTARVSVADIEVRCGPGWDYYVSGRLRHGDEVHVYRHEPGGWLAIRPPEGSFSWIAARQLKEVRADGVGEVAVEGAVAWVGSSVGNVNQYKWQIRLERGELVEVLGKQALSVGPGFATETYYKIAPPAGEFRWIHAQMGHSPNGTASTTPTDTVQLAEYQDATSRDHATGAPTKDTRGGDLSGLREKIRTLNVELSLLVTRQIEQWNLDSLRDDVETLAQEARGTPLAREVRAISHRIAEFETLHRRYEKLSAKDFLEDTERPKSAGGVDGHQVSSAPRELDDDWQVEIARAIGTTVQQVAARLPGPRFDAEGWLMPVHSTRRIAPPFALLDDEGRVQCYVTPSPGLNLRRYTRKRVGLYGKRRYVDALRAPHITVDRVVKQKG